MQSFRMSPPSRFPLPPQSLSVWAENQKRATNNPKFSVNFGPKQCPVLVAQPAEAASGKRQPPRNHQTAARAPPLRLLLLLLSTASSCFGKARHASFVTRPCLGGGDSARPALITCSGTRPVYPLCVCAYVCVCVHVCACVCLRVHACKDPKSNCCSCSCSSCCSCCWSWTFSGQFAVLLVT